MKYQNTKTGFVFETSCKLNGKDWVEIPGSSSVKDEEKKPVRVKKEKKND